MRDAGRRRASPFDVPWCLMPGLISPLLKCVCSLPCSTTHLPPLLPIPPQPLSQLPPQKSVTDSRHQAQSQMSLRAVWLPFTLCAMRQLAANELRGSHTPRLVSRSASCEQQLRESQRHLSWVQSMMGM